MTRTVIVTGSDSGIGAATAIAFAQAGCDVGVTWYDDEPGAKQVADQISSLGRRAVVSHLDVSELHAAAESIDRSIEDLGGLDVLVNNAGIMPTAPFLEIPIEEWRSVLATNLDGAFVCAQRAARRMVDQGRGGRIVNVTSVHELVPLPEAAAYCASKGGLGQLTKVMALELAEHGITVNAVAPGEIATAMSDAEGADVSQEHRPAIPLKRPGDPAEVARVIVHLADPATTYTTGSTYVVDGGLLLMAAVR
jgi:NAD(P)-dependent dehydrogenase (short-subunit alcohol dehydrogenase family)